MTTASEGLRSPRYNAMLTFGRQELLYDIANICYLEAHVTEGAEGAEHARHETYDVVQPGNIDRVTRLLELYWRKATELLFELTRHPVLTWEEERPADPLARDGEPAAEPPKWGVPWRDLLTERRVYGIRLRLPEDFSQTTVNLLEQWVHEYLVRRVVAEWLTITFPAKAEVWMAKAAEAEAEITEAMRHRISGIGTRRMYPF